MAAAARTGQSTIEHPFLGTLELVADAGPDGAGAGASCSARTRPTPAGCTARNRSRRTRRTASTTTWSAGRRRSTRTGPAPSARPGTRLTVAPGETARAAAAAPAGGDHSRHGAAFGTRFERGPRRTREREADEFYAELTPADGQRGRGDGHAAGVRRDAVEQAALLLRREALAGRRPGRADAPGGAPERPQRAVAQLRRVRHHVDAGQVGVPVVRGVGPGVPLRGAGARRSRVRQVPADPAVPGVVPAPERRAARLRVGLLRRQPAGAGVGGAGGVRHRRGPRHRLPQPDLRQAAASTSPGGSTGRTARATTSSRAASSGWTTSARWTARTCRSAAPSSSPTPPAGWASTRSRWAPSPSC